MAGIADLAQLVLALYILAPISALLYMLWLFSTRGGDPKKDSITIQYDPPDQLSPGECGAIVDNAIVFRNVTATITDLSVKGYLAIDPTDATASPSQKDYIFRIKKQPQEWSDLKPHEQQVLRSIFMPKNPLAMLSEAMVKVQAAAKARGNTLLDAMLARTVAQADQCRAIVGADEVKRDSVTLSELRNQFSLHVEEIREAIFKRLIAEGYYASRPDMIRAKYGASGLFIGGLLTVIGIVLAILTKDDAVTLMACGLLTGMFIFGFGGWFLPARTVKGSQTLAKILGFRDFLSRVERDQIARLEKPPELFEKYLPYAIALGVESRWTQTFAELAVIPAQQPGHGGFLPIEAFDPSDR